MRNNEENNTEMVSYRIPRSFMVRFKAAAEKVTLAEADLARKSLFATVEAIEQCKFTMTLPLKIRVLDLGRHEKR